MASTGVNSNSIASNNTNNPNIFHRFSHGHQDLLLAASYNFYGTRLATASSDHKLQVWDRSDATGQWMTTDTWTAHDAEVTDVRWNGPYVGSHLGSIGEDGQLKIWHEDVNEAPRSGRRFRRIFQQASATGVPYASLDFKNLGVETYLAVATRDGYLAVWEPEDNSAGGGEDLSAWRILWAEYLCKIPSRAEETAFRLSWHKEKLPPWQAVLAGLDRRSLSLAVAIGNGVKIFRTDKDRKFYTAATLEGARALVRDVSWANGSMRGYDVIATASKDGFVRIYELHTPAAGTAKATTRLATAAVAPSVASTASATQTSSPMARPARSGIGSQLDSGRDGRRDENSGRPGAVKQDVKLVAELEAHDGAPWRVSWSAMGDVLVSTGDDGTARMWKRSVEGKWLEAAEIDAVGAS